MFEEFLSQFMDVDGLTRVILSISFVVVAIAVSRWQKADLEKDLGIATVRSFIQLILIGYALEFVFAQDNALWTLGILAIMTIVASTTAGNRAEAIPNATRIAMISIGVGSALTLSVLIILGVFQFVPQDVIPIGGMIIGNSMTVATLVMTRLANDFSEQRILIESKLALGATGRQASLMQFQRAIRSAMVPIVDTTKTVGLIKLPGAMTGMILAGASPLEAVQLQLIVMYMLVGATTFTGLIAAYMTYREYFTPSHQLRHVVSS